MNFITNSFQVENKLVDKMMLKISGNELKCYLLILRKTRGWNKIKDAISISQFMKFTGLSNRVVIKCCKKLIKLGFIKRSRGKQSISIFNILLNNDDKTHMYKNNYINDDQSQKNYDRGSYTKNNIKKNIKNIKDIINKNPQNKKKEQNFIKNRKDLLKVIKKFRIKNFIKPIIIKNMNLNKI